MQDPTEIYPMTALMFEESDPIVAEGRQARYIATIPPHIEETPWLDFQRSRARALCDALSLELEKLTRKPTANRVHDTRVALRRWFSIWAILKQDGWESKKIRKQVLKKLRRLLKALGSLRDWDVNLELGTTFGCPPEILAQWQKEQKLVRKSVQARINKLDTAALLMRLRNFLHNRYEKLRAQAAASPDKPLSTYQRLDWAVGKQEERVRALEATASTPEELHQLRLAIKRWRYLMTEFFGLTNLQLVKAQQILGKLNDLQRLNTLLAERAVSPVTKKKVPPVTEKEVPQMTEKVAPQVTGNEIPPVTEKEAPQVTGNEVPPVTEKIKAERERLLSEFAEIRHSLPYGLRPLIVSISPAPADANPAGS